MLPDADLSDPDVEDCLDDEIILLLDPLALDESDYSNDSYTDLMLLYLICYCKISRYCPTI